MVEGEYAYSQKTCISLCGSMNSAATCGCMSLMSHFNITGYDHCLSDDQLRCTYDFEVEFKSGDYITQHCLPKCPLECTQRIMQPVMVAYKFPSSRTYLQSLQNSSSLKAKYGAQNDFKLDLMYNLLQVDFYYDALSYIQVEEEIKMTAEDFLGILGGHLHLFMGMSLLSFVELVECFLVAIVSLIGPAKKVSLLDVSPRKHSSTL